MANVPQVDTVMPDPWWDSHSPLYITQQVATPPPSLSSTAPVTSWYNLSVLTQIAIEIRIDKGYQIDRGRYQQQVTEITIFRV